MNQELREHWLNRNNWKLGCIYVCRADPRIVVAKRVRWTGWTFNFSHPGSYLLLVAVLILATIPSLWTAWYCPDISRLPYAVFCSLLAIALLILLSARIGRK